MSTRDKDKGTFRGIPVVESGRKYRTDEGFSAIKNGVKARREAPQLEVGR